MSFGEWKDWVCKQEREQNMREQMAPDLHSQAVITIIENHKANYPTDIWPEDGESLDCKSAKMARHTCDVLIRLIKDQVALSAEEMK